VSELIKVIGALMWLGGMILLFVAPPLGFLVLVGAIVLSFLSLVRTRRERHEELLAATQSPRYQEPPEMAKDEPPEHRVRGRLKELEALHRDGVITDAEYEQKRREIIGGL
jgi:hypothetical protein